MILRKHPRESARVSTRGSGMAKEGFLCFRREQCLALACLVCLEPQWYTRACCGEGGREHLWCAVQHVAAQHEQQQWQQQQKRVGAVLSTPHMHTQWWTHGRAPKVHTVVCTPVCVCPHTMRAQGGVHARAMAGEYLKDTAVSSDLLGLAMPPRIVSRMVLVPCYARAVLGARPRPQSGRMVFLYRHVAVVYHGLLW